MALFYLLLLDAVLAYTLVSGVSIYGWYCQRDPTEPIIIIGSLATLGYLLLWFPDDLFTWVAPIIIGGVLTYFLVDYGKWVTFTPITWKQVVLCVGIVPATAIAVWAVFFLTPAHNIVSDIFTKLAY